MIDVNQWTMAEKQGVLHALVRQIVGPFDLAEEGVAVFPISSEPIKPEHVATIEVRSQLAFIPRRLVIAEPTISIVEREEFVETSARGWWRRAVTKRHVVEHVRDAVLLRSSWRIHGMFIGNRAQFVNSGTLSGDHFAPGRRDFDFDCDLLSPGLSFCMTVEHRGAASAPFIGVLLGKGSEARVGCPT